ncbi:MAG: hypothetical protein ACTSW8_07945 [Candidatus Thorarchaeota archaeon]
MVTKKQFTILFCVFLFAVIAYQTQPVEAFPFDNEYTDVFLNPGEYSEHYIALTTGDVISGYIETDDTSMGVDFFICDEANFLIWDGGGSATGYEVNTDMHTLGFEWTVTYDDTWYVIISNIDGGSSVYVDIAIDINGDNSPVYDTGTYDFTGYGEVLETGEYHAISANLLEGTEVDGGFVTWFTTDGLDFFICDESNFDDWELGYSATVYSSETNMHSTALDTFTVPTAGVWYFVWDASGQTDAVTLSYGIELDTTNAVTDSGISMISFVGIVAGLLILLILCCVCRSKKKDPDYAPAQPTTDHYVAPPSTPRPTETVREREIVRDRVLVICPYCGSKNEQGVLNCQNCDAEL